MNVILEKKTKDYQLKVAEVISDPEKLYELIRNDLFLDETVVYQSLKNIKRKKEWLSVRILLKEMLGEYHKIKYDPKGNPYIDQEVHLSITHSQNVTGLIISKHKNIGIDSEFVSDRILRTAHKFIPEIELNNFESNQKLKKIYLHWCGKETLYKIKGGGGIDFKKNLNIKITELKRTGFTEGIFQKGNIRELYMISYAFILYNDHELLITWHSS